MILNSSRWASRSALRYSPSKAVSLAYQTAAGERRTKAASAGLRQPKQRCRETSAEEHDREHQGN